MAILLVASLAGCGASASGPGAIEAPSTPGGSGACTDTVAAYCRLKAGPCPTYDQAITRRRALCSQPGTASVVTTQCGGAYRSVSWRDFVLGGGDEYFDDAGRLTAASLVSDYGSAYCGRSFSQTFGTVPECPGEVIRISLCAP
jgi:hypothetical protein